MADLSRTGLLWLINRTVFHPRGFALGLVLDSAGVATSFQLLGTGCEPWSYPAEGEQAKLLAVEKLFGAGRTAALLHTDLDAIMGDDGDGRQA